MDRVHAPRLGLGNRHATSNSSDRKALRATTMCGIVGLLIKKPGLHEPALGELMVPMLIGMTERGPDSAGMAVFGRPLADGAAQDQRVFGPDRDGAASTGAGLADAARSSARLTLQSRRSGQPCGADRPPVAPEPCKRWLHERLSQAAHAVDRPHDRPVQGHRHAGRGGRALRLRAAAGHAIWSATRAWPPSRP